VALYAYQEKVDALLRSGRNIILQAPTGAGKTRAALFSFLDGWRNDPAAFPRQCIYAVPMRVLANQFEFEYKATVKRYTDSHGLREVGTVAIQTGARPDDRRFEADLIFTTIDQVLSSFLTIPYSLGLAQANVNAGAVIGSYLVFDEFHLFPVDASGNGALTTTLHMLQMLKGITPFVLMTATFSETMITGLAKLLDAEPLIVKDDLLEDIPSQQGKQRLFSRCEQILDAEAVWSDFQHHQRKRAIVICNTVERAQKVGKMLQEKAQGTEIRVEVLHSRFFRHDSDAQEGGYLRGRDTKEDEIRHEFGEQGDDKPPYTWSRAILVATQVVEVGLNITCDVLHTEVAPAAAIIQRAGRCARFAGEAGDVLVYDVPLDKEDNPDYAPYLDEGQSELCAKTWQALAGYERRILDFSAEITLVKEVHRDYDTRLLDTLEQNSYALREKIGDAWRDCDRSKGRELIRDIDNRTILIHPDPGDKTIPDPYAWEGISIRKGRLLKWWKEAQEFGEDLDWMVKYPHSPQKIEIGEAEQLRKRTVYNWHTLRWGDKGDDLATVDLLVVNPALVTYDDTLGFRFEPGHAEFTQPKPDPQAKRRGANNGPFSYKRESYEQHIERLYTVYCRDLRPQTAAVQRHLAERLHMSGGVETLEQAIRLMIATHDIGKLNTSWQEWARKWQHAVSQLPNSNAVVEPLDYMYAHTDYDALDKAQQQLQKSMGKRPNHAAEGAWAAIHLLLVMSNDCPSLLIGGEERKQLYHALIAAIVRHHVATAEGNVVTFMGDAGSGKNYFAAKQAFVNAMRHVGLLDAPQMHGQKVRWQFPKGPSLGGMLVDPRNTDEMVLYLVLSRILRLCDQRALEEY
jgi:CRISPR-associated endonuclease/helicase Cas3